MQAARDIMLAEYLRLPVHIAHVSAGLTLDVIAWGKARGVKVSAETCPHYLMLDESSLNGYNSLAKVSPPLRGAKDRAALRQAVKNGLIDILATDHAPHASQEKNVPLDESVCGITGLDTALSLTWELVRENILDESDVARLWCQRPGEIFRLPWNGFAPGDPADFFLFDPEEIWMPGPDTMFSKSCNTPFLGQALHGRVKAHWIGGKRIL
jgi:dihydroorotase